MPQPLPLQHSGPLPAAVVRQAVATAELGSFVFALAARKQGTQHMLVISSRKNKKKLRRLLPSNLETKVLTRVGAFSDLFDKDQNHFVLFAADCPT